MTHTPHTDQQHRAILESIARKAMIERGLLPDFSAKALAALGKIQGAARAEDESIAGGPAIRDLTSLAWCSIDNDDSRDLDQLTLSEVLPGDRVRVYVAIADVDALVGSGGAIDEHAGHNTISVYTPAKIFPMLPERLSTDLTSLAFEEERLAIVVAMVIGTDGAAQSSELFRARVRNHAKLTYNGVAAWLEGHGAAPAGIARVNGLADNLHVQDRIAQSLKALRHVHGALSLGTIEAKPIFMGNQVHALESEQRNRAKEIIEDFMIAANGVTARYLAAQKFPSIRRVVRTPKRWDRIVALAQENGFKLSEVPDSIALDRFLVKRNAEDPLRFPDLSLAVIKLLGAGEYVAERIGEEAPGHFGLAVRDYAHSTAPNRRYADLITQRLVKAAIAGRPTPYTFEQLDVLARHLTEEEDAANKVERQVGKSAAALLLESRIGEKFDAIITGASAKGTWARLLSMPVDGRIVEGFPGVDVGNRIRVQLVSADVERGFIDFKKIG
jgi:VacB/RNase II family 3'-5' exoribonuclease